MGGTYVLLSRVGRSEYEWDGVEWSRVEPSNQRVGGQMLQMEAEIG